jgi:hypothetical protein
VSGQPGQGERRESATDVRLDGDEMAADADDGDAVDATGTYMVPRGRREPRGGCPWRTTHGRAGPVSPC